MPKRDSEAATSETKRQKPKYLPSIDPNQRYAVEESVEYLRVSRQAFYNKVSRGEILIFKDGRRAYCHGSELIRASLPTSLMVRGAAP